MVCCFPQNAHAVLTRQRLGGQISFPFFKQLHRRYNSHNEVVRSTTQTSPPLVVTPTTATAKHTTHALLDTADDDAAEASSACALGKSCTTASVLLRSLRGGADGGGFFSYFSSSCSSATTAGAVAAATGSSNGEVSDLVDDAYEWCMNLGQPSALVAGAVVGTIYENIASGDLDILPEDSKVTRFKKRLTTVLLISAFGLEILSIFVTTVTGTMLLSRPLHDMDRIVPVGPHTTPLRFLRDNFEFEYLTARITYLQGLMNWLASIALNHLIPRIGESRETKIMNRFISSALFSTVTLMLAFYNRHMSFHDNYIEMLSHWFTCILQKYFLNWPPNPMALFYIPATLSTLYWGFVGFWGDWHETGQEEKKKVLPSSSL